MHSPLFPSSDGEFEVDGAGVVRVVVVASTVVARLEMKDRLVVAIMDEVGDKDASSKASSIGNEEDWNSGGCIDTAGRWRTLLSAHACRAILQTG